MGKRQSKSQSALFHGGWVSPFHHSMPIQGGSLNCHIHTSNKKLLALTTIAFKTITTHNYIQDYDNKI